MSSYRPVQLAWGHPRASEGSLPRRLGRNMSLNLPSMAPPARLAPLALRMSEEKLAREAGFIEILAEAKGGTKRKTEGKGEASASRSQTLRSSGKIAAGLGPKPAVQPTRRHRLDPVQDRVMQEELSAKRRVYKLRNELQYSRSTAAIMQTLARKERAGADVRAETKYLQGAHLSGTVGHTLPATEEQVSAVATALMKHLAETEPEPSKRSWFKLFKDFDINGDGHISFSEVCRTAQSDQSRCTLGSILCPSPCIL